MHRGVYERSATMTMRFEEAREKVARFIGAASPNEVVFVRGATEAINLVAQSWGERLQAGDRIAAFGAGTSQQYRALADAAGSQRASKSTSRR